MSGWIKLSREIVHHWVFQEPDSLAVWIRLLLDANYKDKTNRFNGSLVTVKRGQLIFGLNAFSDKTGVSISKLRRIMADLEQEGMISRQKTNKYSVITVLAYDLYQSLDSLTAMEDQATDNQTATPKEGKKERKKEVLCPFDDFWHLYPKKQGKKEAEKAWNKLNPSQDLFNQIENHLKIAYLGREKQYIPNASTYLNQEKFNDEVIVENQLPATPNQPVNNKSEGEGEFTQKHTDRSWRDGL